MIVHWRILILIPMVSLGLQAKLLHCKHFRTGKHNTWSDEISNLLHTGVTLGIRIRIVLGFRICECKWALTASYIDKDILNTVVHTLALTLSIKELLLLEEFLRYSNWTENSEQSGDNWLPSIMTSSESVPVTSQPKSMYWGGYSNKWSHWSTYIMKHAICKLYNSFSQCMWHTENFNSTSW